MIFWYIDGQVPTYDTQVLSLLDTRVGLAGKKAALFYTPDKHDLEWLITVGLNVLFFPFSLFPPATFSLVQSNLGRLGNLKKWGDNSEKKAQAAELAEQGMRQVAIAAALGVNQGTVCRWLKVAK